MRDGTSAVVCAGVVVADHLCTPIDHVPRPGELVKADDLILNIGGCAANVALALGKVGVRSTLCGRVGGDVFGRFVTETLVAGGVDVSGLAVDRDHPTSQTLIVNVKGEDRRFVHAFGANAGLSVSDLDSAIGRSTRVLYVGGYLILPGLDPSGLAALFRRARGMGVMTVLDVVVPGPGDHLDRLRPVLPEVDLFLPNSDEGAVILGEPDPIRQARAYRELGASRVVVTRGEAGLVAVSDALEVELGTFPVDFVDGTGSGDAFDAGYIAGFLDGADELSCLTFAAALGASCVRAVGATAGIFDRGEAEAFLRRHSLSVRPI